MKKETNTEMKEIEMTEKRKYTYRNEERKMGRNAEK